MKIAMLCALLAALLGCTAHANPIPPTPVTCTQMIKTEIVQGLNTKGVPIMGPLLATDPPTYACSDGSVRWQQP
jgi:hypothetical protein